MISFTELNSLSFGVPGRLPRIVPEPGETFNGYYLPAGVCVLSRFTHRVSLHVLDDCQHELVDHAAQCRYLPKPNEI